MIMIKLQTIRDREEYHRDLTSQSASGQGAYSNVLYEVLKDA